MKMRKISNRILAYTLTLAILLSTCLFGAVTTTAEESEIAVWDGTTAENFAGGDGSASKPYLIENGAQVLHDRSVELARDHGIEVEVLSAFKDTPGTIVGPME